MPCKWLHVKGDPSVRAFRFHQSRVESLFGGELDRVHRIARRLLSDKGAFHVKVHFSTSQLTRWLCDAVCRFRVYVKERGIGAGFYRPILRFAARSSQTGSRS